MIPWKAGVQLGPYELIAPIGAGGMGEVWKARDTRLNRVVALKSFNGQDDGRFAIEARAVAAVNHPHICLIYDIGPDYLVLEYVDGVPLPCPLEREEAVRLAICIAAAVEAAHAKGIIHRDLKPSNILMTRDRSIKLLDFGLAKLMGHATDATAVTVHGSVLGTAAYMSPEQAEGKTLDERSDIFSFGAVLYEMLSGERAFGGATTAQVLSAVLFQEPGPLQVEPALERIVRRCLAKRPPQRFQSMSEVRKALEAISTRSIERQPSVAVLPFTIISADKEDEYFSDGLAEEIINALGHIQGLNVTARTSSFSFRGKDLDIRKVAELLDVQTILEGSVRRAGNRIRVTVQLINAENGYHIWSERFDREMADVFAIQDEIAQAIASSLKVRLSPESLAGRRYTPPIPAYEAFLQGRHFLRRGTPESFRRALECLKRAISLDPHFALAHSELASCYRLLASLGDAPTGQALLDARGAAQHALLIDPALPEAHAQLAAVALFLDYDWPTAGHHFQLAMAHDPIPAEVNHLYGFFYLMPLGRLSDASREMERCLKADPLNLECLTQYAVVLWAIGRDEEACKYLNQTLQLEENFWLALFLHALWHSRRGSVEVGLASAQKAHAVAPKTPNSVGLLAGMLWRSGDIDKAEQMVEALGDGTSFEEPLAMLVYNLARLDFEKAADWAEKAIEQRDPNALPACCGSYRQDFVENGRWPRIARLLRLPETAN